METKQFAAGRRLYVEKQNPLFISLTILPFIMAVLGSVFLFMGIKGGAIAVIIVGIVAGGCYFMPWAMLNYWKNRKAYTHKGTIKGVFVLDIIGLVFLLIGFVGAILMRDDTIQADGSVTIIAAIAYLIMLIMGLVFTFCNTKKHIDNKIRRAKEKAAKKAAKLALYKKNMGFKSNRSWTTTFVLSVLLGMFGAHRMYVGKKAYGITTLVLSLLGIGWIVFFIPWIVDFGRILCHTYKDKQGKVITRERTFGTTLVLCILFGMFGAHRMFVGKKAYGIVTLVLTLLLIGWIAFFIPWIVDFAKILCHSYKDKWGRPISDVK